MQTLDSAAVAKMKAKLPVLWLNLLSGLDPKHDKHIVRLVSFFVLLDAAWVRSRAERPSVSYTKVTSKVAWTGHNLQFTKTNSNNKLAAATNTEKRGTGR